MEKKKILKRLNEIKAEVKSLFKNIDGIEGDEEQRNQSLNDIQSRYEELLEERRDLESQLEELDEIETRNKKTLRAQNLGTGIPGTVIEKNNIEERGGADRLEYKNAWLKKLAKTHTGKYMFGEPTEEEQRAFIITTQNTGSVVPTDLQNQIIDRVKAEAPMLEDTTISAMTHGFAIPVRTKITAGDAAVVAEDGANVDEQDDFDLIELSGVDIKKHAIMTRRMKFQSIDAFENWLVSDLSKRIMVAKEKVLLARLDGTSPGASTSAVQKVAIDSANVLKDQAYDDKTIRKIMALIDEPGQVVIYANRSTIYNGLAGIKTEDGKKAYIDNAQVDPTVKGILYGAVVKSDVNIPNNVAYFGVKGSIIANSFAPLEVFPTTEAKTANVVYTGTEIFDGGLGNPKAFVKVTFTGE